MKITSYYPVLAVRDVARSIAFYREHFGFRASFEADWYAHLTMDADVPVNLGLVRHDHETVPGDKARAGGLLINIEVADVDAVHARLKAAGLPMLRDLVSEDFGQRHFINCDPDGVMIDVITPIAPSAEFAAQYLEGAPA